MFQGIRRFFTFTEEMIEISTENVKRIAVWLKPELLPRRVTFAGDLAGGNIPGLGLKKQRPSEAALAETLGPTLSQETRQAAQRTSGDIGAAVILGSPDFMRY